MITNSNNSVGNNNAFNLRNHVLSNKAQMVTHDKLQHSNQSKENALVSINV